VGKGEKRGEKGRKGEKRGNRGKKEKWGNMFLRKL
jgi:hypothetical protein